MSAELNPGTFLILTMGLLGAGVTLGEVIEWLAGEKAYPFVDLMEELK